MITKPGIELDPAASSEQHMVASVLFLLCFHTAVLAVALLTGKSQSTVAGKRQ